MNLEIGKDYKVTVVNIIQHGCIVELEDGSTKLIHLSQISNQFVNKVEDFTPVGATFMARGVEGLKDPVQLSLKHLDLHSNSPRVHTRTQDSSKFNKPDASPRKQHTSEISPAYGCEFKEDDYDEERNYSRSTRKPKGRSNYHANSGYNHKQKMRDKYNRKERRRKDKYFD